MAIDVNQLSHCDMEDTLVLTTPLIPGVIYTWDGPVAINTTGNEVIIPNVEFDYEGTYTVFGTNADGCTSIISDEVEVDIIEAPELERDDVSVLFETLTVFDVLDNDNLDPNQPFTLEVLDEPAKGTLEQNPDGTFSYTPFENALDSDFFTYQICYDACEFLCSSTLVTLNIQYDQEECIIPNVITPNGDASNDILIISCLESNNEPDNQIIIFNEWGDEVFKAAPYQNDWDGTYNGEPLPDGTYYYVFTKNDNSKTHQRVCDHI
jgi:gliding motility-associated-like protein